MNERHRAEIRGGVMEEGKARDAVCFFPSESQDAAFRHALEIGYRERAGHEQDGRWLRSAWPRS